jgi:hypothetical protein
VVGVWDEEVLCLGLDGDCSVYEVMMYTVDLFFLPFAEKDRA